MFGYYTLVGGTYAFCSVGFFLEGYSILINVDNVTGQNTHLGFTVASTE